MKSFYIIHEGCTEEHYMYHIFDFIKIPRSTLKVQFHNFNGGSPTNAFKMFKSFIDDESHNHIKHYLVIMDNDVELDKVIETKANINEYTPDGKHVTFVTFEPCIEGFLIAHFEENYKDNTYNKCINREVTDSPRVCAQCFTHLKNNYLLDYRKNDCNVSFFNSIKKDKIMTAYRNTKSLQDIIEFLRIVA